jgi:hypothetical protein
MNRQRRALQHLNQGVVLCIGCIATLLLTARPSLVQATITFTELGIQYESYPANSFGRGFDFGYEYEARLQIIPQDEYLCGEENNSSSTSLFVVPQDNIPGMMVSISLYFPALWVTNHSVEM